MTSHAVHWPWFSTRPSDSSLGTSGVTSRWRRPSSVKLPKYIQASCLVAVGGLLFGLDTGTIGPVSSMNSFQNYINSSSSTVHGLVVSSILIPAAIASFFAGHLADRLGRPRAITVGALIFAIGAAMEAATLHIAMFFVGRAITGIGEGLFLSTVVVYTCEISPANRRGPLTCLGQFQTTVGIFLGYFVSYGTVKIDNSASWRLPLALQSFLAFAYSAACITLLDSPRWLAQCGRYEESERVWEALGVSKADLEIPSHSDSGMNSSPASPDSAFELQELKTSSSRVHATENQPSIISQSHESGKVSFLRVFAKDVRSRTALGAFVLGMQQLSGIDGVLYYAPLLFRQAGLTAETASFLASGVSAIVMMAVTVPGFLLADHWGRRTSAITGGVVMSTCMILMGSLYGSGSVHPDSGAARWVVIVAIYLFAAVFCVTFAICFRAYPSEIQPPVTRAAATSLAQSANWVSNFFVALITPIILARSSSAIYFLFGACTCLTTVVCFFYMRETRGKTLESIDESFRAGAKDIVPAGLTRRLPWNKP